MVATKHVCDCGAGYSNLDALYACQSSRHGAGPLPDPLREAAPELLSIARRWVALDGGAWHSVRNAREKVELIADTRAAIAKATNQET